MRVDVAVVGAGTAGAAVAALAAQRGLSVVCVDRRPLDRAGARWVNGVPGWMFDEAGLARPAGDELLDPGAPFHLVAGYSKSRVTVRGHDVLGVDMRLLVARLQGLAEAAGATLLGDVRVDGRSGRTLATSAGPIEARTFVDASGLAGARLLAQPPPARSDLCAAAQEVRAVRDVAAARAFFHRHGAEPGDSVAFSGIAGGFSTLALRLEGDTISILTGSIPADGHRPGERILKDFVSSHAWVGDTIFGGARAIPLGAAYPRIAEGDVALVGDAAVQVFSAHGSGIGAGLVAAKVLIDALAAGRGVHGYAVEWQRRFGAVHAAYDRFRRFTQTLDATDVARLMDAGLLDETTAAAGLAQRWPVFNARLIGRVVVAALRAPRLAARMLPVTLGMPALRAHYQRFPDEPAALAGWARRAVLGVA